MYVQNTPGHMSCSLVCVDVCLELSPIVGERATPERTDILDLDVDIPLLLRNVPSEPKEPKDPKEKEEPRDRLDALDREVNLPKEDWVRPVAN